MLATKSRRTSSTRRLSVWSSASSRIRPPPPTAAPSGATRTAKLVRLPPNALPDTSISPSRISPSRRTWRARARSSPIISWSPLTRPKERAAALARSTRSWLSSTTAEDESTDSTDATPGGSRGACRRSMPVRHRGGLPADFHRPAPGITSRHTRACGRGTTRHLHAHTSMVCALGPERSWPGSHARCAVPHVFIQVLIKSDYLMHLALPAGRKLDCRGSRGQRASAPWARTASAAAAAASGSR